MAGRGGTAPTKNGPTTPYLPPAKHEKTFAIECFFKNMLCNSLLHVNKSLNK